MTKASILHPPTHPRNLDVGGEPGNCEARIALHGRMITQATTQRGASCISSAHSVPAVNLQRAGVAHDTYHPKPT